jgi:hypothetical protein
MSMNTVWSCIETLAAALDGNRAAAEQSLDEFERAMRQLERGRRDEVRRLMILIVAGLSRLEVRMMETDGPLNSAYQTGRV